MCQEPRAIVIDIRDTGDIELELRVVVLRNALQGFELRAGCRRELAVQRKRSARIRGAGVAGRIAQLFPAGRGALELHDVLHRELVETAPVVRALK